jgi:parallel beta-helix repeat protein
MKLKLLGLICFSLVTIFSGKANTYTVTVAGNWGGCGTAGSFGAAVCAAAANPGNDIIQFNLPGGTNITGWPQTITGSDLLIDGFSTIDGLPIGSAVSMVCTGNNVEFRGINFQTATHSLDISGSNNIVRSCGFVTSGAGQNSLWIKDGTGNQVINSTFTSSQLHAISIEKGGSHTIDGCAISNSQDIGIMIRGTGSNTVTNTAVELGSKNGIGVENCNGNTIENTTTRNNAWAGIVLVPTWDGPVGNYSNNNTITNCEVHGNGENGIEILGENNLVDKTRVYNNCTAAVVTAIAADYTYAGIKIKGGTNTILATYVYDNKANGILIDRYVHSNGTTVIDNAAGSIVKNCLVGRNSSGTYIGNNWNGVFVRYSNNVTVEGSIIVSNGRTANNLAKISGVRYQEVTGGTISANFIGTDATPNATIGNAFDGITLHTNVTNVVISSNTIGFNGSTSSYGNGGGIALRGASNNNTIQSNNIGRLASLADVGNYDYGISVEGSSGNTIGGNSASLGNFIGNSKNKNGTPGRGVWLVLPGASGNQLYNNTISSNIGDGIVIERGAVGNIVGAIGAGNTINSNKIGIAVKENAGGTTNNNTLRGNAFSCNTVKGISLTDNGNNLYGFNAGTKILTTNMNELRANYVSGTAPNNAVVDVYVRDANCAVLCDSDVAQGVIYVATVTANGAGVWEYNFAGTTALTKANVIVLATEPSAAGVANTSEFSVCVYECTAPQNVNITGASVCAGGSATLLANSSGISPAGTYQYYWYLNSVYAANEILPRNAINDNDIMVNTNGTYIVVISETSDPASCTGTSAPFVFTLNALPTVTVNDATICAGGAAATFVATSGTAAKYTWSANGSGTGLVTTGTTAGNYTVQIEDVNGCKASGTGVLTVDNDPLCGATCPDTTIGGSITPECVSNGTINLTAINGGKTGIWVITSGPAGATISSGSTFNVNNTPGDYVLTFQIAGAGGLCDPNPTRTIRILELPSVTVNDATICIGDPAATFTATSAAATVYVWSVNGTGTASTTTGTATGDYTVVVSDASNCTATATGVLTVNALPVVTVNNETICEGEVATFTVTHSNKAGSYLWSDKGTGAAATTSGTAAGNYTVQFTDNNGCKATGAGILTVNPAPTINFNASSYSFCTGGSVRVDAGTDMGVTAAWTPIQTPSGYRQITVTKAGYYGLTVTDSYGCSDSSGVTVTENPLPVISVNDARFCKGSSLTFDAGNPGKLFTWNPNGESTQTVTATKTGAYTVTVIDTVSGCINQGSAFAEENPDETADLKITGNDTICYLKGESTDLTVTFAGTYGLEGTLEWSNGITDDETARYSEEGTVWVTYTDTFNCVAADSLEIIDYCPPPIVDVPNVFIPGGCPTCNPTFTPFGDIEPSDVISGHMEIYDRWGLRMYQTDELMPEWDGTYNGRTVSSGVYFWIWIYTDVTETEFNLNGFVQVLKKK